MRKIRIGNDIRLKLKIEPNTIAGFDKIDEFDLSNVKQLRCYLINTSFCKPCCDEEPKKFQRVGFPDFYHPEPHNINNAGFPSYHMAPANMCNYDRFSPDFHDFHWWPGYRGFGIHPEHFHEYCGHLHWHGTRPSHYYPHCHNHHDLFQPHHPFHEPFYHGYDHHGIEHCKPEPFDTWLHPEYVPVDVFGKENVVLNHPHPYQPYYLADSQVLNEKNTLTCMFPAVQLKMCGIYKLIVVLTVFEQGWGRHNLRTYTIDKGDVFELVDDGGESGAITLDVDSTGLRENLIANVYSEIDNYVMADDTTLPIGGFDLEDNQYNIYVVLKDGTTVMYNPYDWKYNRLLFESSNPDVLEVDKLGHLHAHTVDEPVVVDITVTSEDDETVKWVFHVTVKPTDSIKIGFNEIEHSDDIESDHPSLNEYSTKPGNYIISNLNEGDYMWIFSLKRIHYIKTYEDTTEKVAELSSGFRVPLTAPVIKDGYFCYRSVAPIRRGEMYIKIKFD